MADASMNTRQSKGPMIVAAAVFLSACTSHGPASVPATPPAIDFSDQPGLTVVLAWDASVDLDLYVTDPTWETVYFANNPSRSGARLTQDVRCKDVAGRGSFQEVVRIADPLPGGYRVGVDFIERCSGESEYVSFRVATGIHGMPPQDQTVRSNTNVSCRGL
jgi:hypothetical protein